MYTPAARQHASHQGGTLPRDPATMKVRGCDGSLWPGRKTTPSLDGNSSRLMSHLSPGSPGFAQPAHPWEASGQAVSVSAARGACRGMGGGNDVTIHFTNGISLPPMNKEICTLGINGHLSAPTRPFRPLPPRARIEKPKAYTVTQATSNEETTRCQHRIWAHSLAQPSAGVSPTLRDAVGAGLFQDRLLHRLRRRFRHAMGGSADAIVGTCPAQVHRKTAEVPDLREIRRRL